MKIVLLAVLALWAAGWAQPQAPLDFPGILIDGSSTAAPIFQAATSLFSQEHPEARISVGISGTSGGFRRFLAAEIDIATASRPIRPSEMEKAKANGIEFLELMIALDGIAVAVSTRTKIFKPGVTPVLTVGELILLWGRESEGLVTDWSHLGSRFSPGRILLSGPAATSGTFDFFTEAVLGKIGESRADYFGTEEDQLLAELTGSEPYALTYLGFAYLEHNRDLIQAVAIDPRPVVIDPPEGILSEVNRRRAAAGKPPLVPEKIELQGIYPTVDTIAFLLYQPLTRPLFAYVNLQSLRRPLVRAFLEFVLGEEIAGNPEFMLDVGYVPLSPKLLAATRKILAETRVGTAFPAGTVSPAELLALYLRHADLK